MSLKSLVISVLSSFLLFSIILFVPLSVGGPTESWVTVSHSPGIYNYGTAVTGAQGDIYILNSSNSGDSNFCHFWRYNTVENTWDTLSVPSSGGLTRWAKNGSFMTWDQENYIYAVFGGSYSDSARYHFYRYNIPNDTWENLADTPRTQGAGDAIEWVPGSAVGTETDWIYAVIGAKDPSVQSNCEGTYFSRYDISSNNWENLTYNQDWSEEGSDDGSSLVWAGGDYLYALQGEWDETNENVDRAFARFDITDNSWTDLENIPEEGGVGDGGSLAWAGNEYSNKVYALGGGYVGPDETPGDNFYVYDIPSDNWTQLQSLPYGMTNQNGPRLGYADGSLYCWRGYYQASNNPDVLMAYELPAVGVSVSISPAENNALKGENVTFTVTVTNVDDEHHNFVLENSDSLGWQMSLSEDNLSLDSDNSENVVLEVAIPPAVSGGTGDTVTVTATAQDNADISSSAGCTAGAQVNVDFNVWITPFSQTGSREDNLDYVVHVKNTGNVVDNYDLVITDNAGWADNVSLAGSGYSETDNSLPRDDAMIEDNNTSANYGTSGDVEVGSYVNDGYVMENHRGYWQFDLSSIPDSASITNATFSAFTHYGGENYHPDQPGYGYMDEDVSLSVKGVSDDGWDEATITWSSAPSMGSTLDSLIVPPTDDMRYNFDVTSFVSNQLSDDTVSLGMISENEGKNEFVPWTAKESQYWEGQESYLKVSYEVSDVVRLTNVSPGENENVALNVTIPNSADLGAHTIKVEATSHKNGDLSLENSCTASVGSPTGVEVSVSPSEDNAPPGYELNYDVTITNTGGGTDNYDLTVVDNAGWTPSLDDNLFENVAPGKNRKTTLRVTIPEGTDMGIEDNITVTATSQENAQVTDNASCTALSAALVRGVKVTVSPSLKGGYLGSTLEYSVTVKNEGNVPDNYELNASDDADPSWNPSFADNLLENVQSGEEKSVSLSVTIPDNHNLVGATDNITVTATSLENTPVSDNEICHAEAVEPPVGGVFHSADRERLEEQGRGTLTAFLVPLAAVISVLAFAVGWRRRE